LKRDTCRTINAAISMRGVYSVRPVRTADRRSALKRVV